MKNLAGLPHSRHFGPLVPSPGVRVFTFSDRQVGPCARGLEGSRKVTRQRPLAESGAGTGGCNRTVKLTATEPPLGAAEVCSRKAMPEGGKR